MSFWARSMLFKSPYFTREEIICFVNLLEVALSISYKFNNMGTHIEWSMM